MLALEMGHTSRMNCTIDKYSFFMLEYMPHAVDKPVDKDVDSGGDNDISRFKEKTWDLSPHLGAELPSLFDLN